VKNSSKNTQWALSYFCDFIIFIFKNYLKKNEKVDAL